MQGLSEYEFVATADTLIDEIRDGKGLVSLTRFGRNKKAMLKAFDSVTLEDMIKMQKKKLSKPKALMCYI